MFSLRTLKMVPILLAATVFLLLQGSGQVSLKSKPGQEIYARATNQSNIIQVTAMEKIRLFQPGELISLCDLEGQMYGAGKGRVVALGEDGKITKSFVTSIDKPSISAHSAATLIIGDTGKKVLFLMNTESGKMSELLRLSSVRDSAQNQYPEASLLETGELMSVASNGHQVFVAIGAGYSSAIFKIDPATKQIVGRNWAPGADPTAMAFHEGGLYVLVGNGRQVRRFTESLERSLDRIDLPVSEAKGLAIRKDEIRILTDNATSVGRFRIPVSSLSVAAIQANVDKIRLPNIIVGGKIEVVLGPQNYAILICGDLAENFYGDNFWNDTVWMYKTLLNNGYKPENIFVLYGDGVDYASANPRYRHPTRVTDFPATRAWVNRVLDGLKNGDPGIGIPKMKANDTLFVWTFDHGSWNRTSAYLCLRDGSISDTDFSAKLDAIAYASRAFFMQQCHSGGFIDNLRNSKTFISTACKANEGAHPADTENEVYMGRDYWHGEYNYHIICALDRMNPAGGTINADSNHNGLVSCLEAHNWNVLKENQSETPQMDDIGGIGSSFQFRK